MNRRFAPLARLLAVAAFALAPCGVAAQEYPIGPVKIIVPFSPGGPGDLTARFIAQELQEALGQPFVVENRPGANGVIAAGAAAKTAADGYTLLQISSSHTVNESLIPNKPYALMRDFEPVASLNFTDMVMMIKNDLAARSVAEFIALAKTKSGALNYASSGNGSAYHMAAELFKTMAGVSIAHIPYKSAAAARTDLVGGHVDLMFDALPSGIELVRAGKVRALATTARSRSSALPDVPTLAEAGLAGYESTIFVGLMAPKGTPARILDRLHGEINKVLARPQSIEFWKKQGAQPMITSRDAYTRFLVADIAQGERIVKLSGAKVD